MRYIAIIGIIVLLVFITGCTTEGIPERACIKQTEKNGSTYYDLFLGACEDFKEIIYVNVTKYVDKPIVKEVVKYVEEKCGECPDCPDVKCEDKGKEENKMDEELIEEHKADDDEDDEDKDEEEEEAIDDETDEDEDGG